MPVKWIFTPAWGKPFFARVNPPVRFEEGENCACFDGVSRLLFLFWRPPACPPISETLSLRESRKGFLRSDKSTRNHWWFPREPPKAHGWCSPREPTEAHVWCFPREAAKAHGKKPLRAHGSLWSSMNKRIDTVGRLTDKQRTRGNNKS